MFRDVGGRLFKEVRLADLPEVAKLILKEAGDLRIWLFTGEMGAGKTTLIKAICHALGVTDTMSSPTFSIINEYAIPGRGRVLHFDFFRIRNEGEAYDIGTDEYFNSGDFCFIEWPEKIEGLLPESYARIAIQPENESLRTIALSVHDGKEKNRI